MTKRYAATFLEPPRRWKPSGKRCANSGRNAWKRSIRFSPRPGKNERHRQRSHQAARRVLVFEGKEATVSLSVSELAALGKLFEEHRPKLLAMLRRKIDPVLAVRIDAEEILQEAFFMAHRRWPQLESSG